MHTSLALSTGSCPVFPFPKTIIPGFEPPKFPSLKSHSFKSIALHCTSPIQVADLVEKDYSFLESSSIQPQHSRILSAAQISENSQVLIPFPTLGFVNRAVEEAKCELVACVHESLFVLAMIKEGDDRVRCFQGGGDVVPKKFVPFDAVFVCYFPTMGVQVEELIARAKNMCTQGGRLVICFDQGRKVMREYNKLYSDVANVDLPDKTVFVKAAAGHAFELTDFVNEPDLYLAVLKF